MDTAYNNDHKMLHKRTIEITTHQVSENMMLITGVLRDDRFQETHLMTGEIFPAGAVHDITIQLSVKYPDLTIEDISVRLNAVPRTDCHETSESLAPIKGMAVTKGFTANVKDKAGGRKGCTHLIELISAMGPAVIQGYAANRLRQPQSFDHHFAKKMLQNLLNTCYAWRQDGPVVNKHVAMMHQAKECTRENN